MKKYLLSLSGFLIVLLLAACSPSVSAEVASVIENPGNIPEGIDSSTPTAEGPTLEPESTSTSAVTEMPSNESLDTQKSDDLDEFECNNPFGDTSIRFNVELWDKTDFCKHNIDYSEILSGGPPPDGIPPIDNPAFESVAAADEWLGAQWPVMFFIHDGDARAYPLAILMWHEIVNDVVGGKPVSLTFCPLCNATIAFNRELPDGTLLDFGTSGNLRNSDLVMYDRQTQSWWQQFTGEGIVGFYTGTRLELLPSQIVAWEDFKSSYPDGMVLSRDTGYNRSYGRNPYIGYDDINSNPFLYDGPRDGRLPATSRVAAIEINGVWKAYPFKELAEVGVVNDDISGEKIVVFWQGNTASALDSSDMENSKIVGSTAIYTRLFEGQELTFELNSGGGFLDLETGSLWNIFGIAVEGPLVGAQLDQIVSAEHFWFAWAAFRPDTLIWSID